MDSSRNKKLKIAVVGSGVSGLVTAWLLSKHHHVSIFEKNDYVGGHVHTPTFESSFGSIVRFGAEEVDKLSK